jgi:prepilin-type N-terminal cleavage/methylation domain-containing protein
MERGFSLLEIVIAITIFASSVILLLEIEANHIKKMERSFKEIEALKFFQEHTLRLKVLDDRFEIKTEKRYILPTVREIRNIVIDRKKNEPVIEIITYED